MCLTRIMEASSELTSVVMALVCYRTEGIIHYRVASACCYLSFLVKCVRIKSPPVCTDTEQYHFSGTDILYTS